MSTTNKLTSIPEDQKFNVGDLETLERKYSSYFKDPQQLRIFCRLPLNPEQREKALGALEYERTQKQGTTTTSG
jgi:hypothetical protein